MLLLAVGLLGACDDSGEEADGGGTEGEDRAANVLALEGDAAAGMAGFGTFGCSNESCHGADGLSGMASPSLNMSVPNASDEVIVNTFLNGKGSMPPQSARTDQELADLLAYVSETFGG